VSSINGIGHSYYGKGDFEGDGTFTSTKWIIFVYFPIVPLKSVRVDESEKIVAELPIFWRQVFNIYAYLYVLGPLLVAMSEKFHWRVPTQYAAFFLWAALPTILRFLAKQRTLSKRA
jgi:hypothetical protein